ncbi:glycosyltransferase family 2 protein [Robiginitalea sp. M366]|uniref:glycosyltransferase family 2 protein n=1 Tax=Robiginitalea aestuariiviva TaxID=3036903 RepID=UPI00240D0295|nr:glycosyltransferase family 2 protein [Robiginitalea aestuariiviva]MDG1572854.1 glycosyltransferase family 2 protein [Robiginitalea aestuariiviva]
MPAPSIAIVILNWNGKALLERFLPSVVRYSPGAEIMVADNASEDDSVAFLQEAYPQVRIIQNPENGGFAQGYNWALEAVETDLYCLLNSDVEVTEGWLDPVLDLFKRNPEIGIIQPKIRDLLHPSRFEYAGAAGGFLDRFGYPFCRGRIFQTLEEDLGQYDDTRPIFWATGACMFIRKSVFRELEGFDADYFAHQEEVDLCWRAHNHGHQVYYTGESAVYHLGGSTLSNMDPRKTYLNFRNSLFSITKNLPRKKAFPIIFCRLLLDGVAALRFLLQGRLPHALAILRAHLSYYRQVRTMLRKRERVKFVLKYHEATSIVWSYYVNGIKNFNILVKD